MVFRLRFELGLGYSGQDPSQGVSFVDQRQKYNDVCRGVFVCDGWDPAGADLVAWVGGKVAFLSDGILQRVSSQQPAKLQAVTFRTNGPPRSTETPEWQSHLSL